MSKTFKSSINSDSLTRHDRVINRKRERHSTRQSLQNLIGVSGSNYNGLLDSLFSNKNLRVA